jgi:hypothetical protein
MTFSVLLLALVDACYKFTVVDIGLYRRNSDGWIFTHSKLGKHLEAHLGILEDKQLPGTTCLAPHVIVGDEAFPLKTYLMRPYPESQSRGDNEKSIFNYCLSWDRRGGKYMWNIKPEISNLSEDPTLITTECRHIFVTCILHNCLWQQGIGLRDMGTFANVRSNLTNIPNQGQCVLQSAFQEKNLNNSLIVCLDLCLGRMVQCNVRLICNNPLSWMLSWNMSCNLCKIQQVIFYSCYSSLLLYVINHILPLPWNAFSVIF